MRKMQNQRAFDDFDNFDERKLVELVGTIVRAKGLSEMRTTDRSYRMRLVCLECSTKFKSANQIPECPGCGGTDVELQES